MKKILNLGNLVVIVTTFLLFAVALFATGFTKDLLLEAGVLLVSIKIIILGAENKKSNMEILEKLNEINQRLKQSETKKTNNS